VSRCLNCGRVVARSGAAWNKDFQRAMRATGIPNAKTCGASLGSFWADDSVPDCKEATIERLRARVSELEMELERAQKGGG
jgi:hypothetical protein